MCDIVLKAQVAQLIPLLCSAYTHFLSGLVQCQNFEYVYAADSPPYASPTALSPELQTCALNYLLGPSSGMSNGPLKSPTLSCSPLSLHRPSASWGPPCHPQAKILGSICDSSLSLKLQI